MAFHVYAVLPDGNLQVLGDDVLHVGAVIGRRRAARVLPVNLLKRAAFVLLRRVFGDNGRAAAWSRSWRGPWQGRILGSARTFTHASRRVVLAWERVQIERDMLNRG